MTKRLTIALVAVAMFVLLAVMPVSAYNVGQNISQGATVFIGEGSLNLTQAQFSTYLAAGSLAPAATIVDNTADTIGWWASAANIQATSPTKTISLVGRNTTFQVASTDFVGFTGNWYIVNKSTNYAMQPAMMSVQDPSLAVSVWDFGLAVDQSGKSVVQGRSLGFKVDTNMYAAINAPTTRFPVAGCYDPSGVTTFFGGEPYATQPNDGYLDIRVKDSSGSILSALVNGSWNAGAQYANPLTRQNVSFQPWYWGTAPSTFNLGLGFVADPANSNRFANWSTGALDANGQYVYPPGTYTVYVESQLNGMKDNYKNAGADYTGKTVSAVATVTLVSDSVKIEANKDSVVRSKPFSVTITGRPSTTYHVWVKGVSTLNGGFDAQAPMIAPNQVGVSNDSATGAQGGTNILGAPGVAGNYLYQNGNGNTIWNDVAFITYSGENMVKTQNGTVFYANVSTSSSGTRTVEFMTTNWTKAQKYTIRVEQQFGGTANDATIGRNFNINTGTYFSDEVDVKVEKGAVTIVAAGDQSYYLGEEIKFSGTNTETYTTYLFLIGPNLPTRGALLSSTNPRAAGVTDGAANTFTNVAVLGDNTWSYKWGTSTVALDAGTYTIYAVSQPRSAADNNLANAAYGTVSIIIKKPFVSAVASQSTVAQGDKLFITGTAEGNPVGVQIWVLGKNYPLNAQGVVVNSVNADASFKYELQQGTTRTLYPGQYFVVVQHPMQNNVFDVYVNGNDVWNRQLGVLANGGQKVFSLLGASSLQGSDAAEALVQAINDPNVDDTYTKLQFLVEVPVIRIDPIGDKHVGDKFTITASTNLAVDDEVLVQVYSSSFKPTQKSQSGEFSGATGTVKVAKGDSGMNKLSFDVDSSTFKPDEYIVTEQAVIQDATATALFNVLEGAAPTAVPTKAVVTTTAVPTAVPTTIATAVPTPIPTTKSPGYGALIALIGLGAVAFIVVRRH